MAAEQRSSRWIWRLPKNGAVILLLWLLFAQALIAARVASITFDEGPHLAVGYATLRTGDLRLQPVHIHPPLANMLAAAPLLLNPDLPDPRAIPGWEIASLSAITDTVVWQYPHPARLALVGRLPIVLLTLLVGATVWRWAADLGGSAAGLLALSLFAFDPNIIAHGSLITTDMAVTAFVVLAFFLLYRYLCRPSWARLIGVGLALGLALASKVSAVLLPLLVGAVLVLRAWRGSKAGQWSRRTWLSAVAAPLVVIGLVAFLALWAVYGFELRVIPDLAGSVPLPAATHLEVYRSLQEHYQLGHPAFLKGQNSDQGWWYYFPLAFLIKTPLPTLILLGIALLIYPWRRQSADVTLMLFPLVYAVTALFSSVDIGYRHLLPILPFAYAFIGSVLHASDFMKTSQNALYRMRLAQYGLFLWLAAGTLLIHPYPLTFFNEMAGGSGNGYRWLVDSNLDWGQNLWQLRDWMRAEGVERVYYSHYSPARPEAYGIVIDWLPPDPRALPFAPFDPAAGVYVIGATTLQGVYTPDVNTFSFFRARQPKAVLGHALFVYRVPERSARAWAAVCIDAPISDQQIRAAFGQPDMRLVFFDCRQSRVYPASGNGWYILPPQVKGPEGADLVLQARDVDGLPTFLVLNAGDPPVPATPIGSVTMDGPLSFLGYQLDRVQAVPGEQIVLNTFWQVEWTPDRPLSLMAHLLGPGGVPVAVGDGLGVPIEGWQRGDKIVQIHRLVLPTNMVAGDYRLQTGAYWLDTLERWTMRSADGTISDRLLLDKIPILD